MDLEKQIDYWRTGSDEDLAAAESLLETGHLRHCLFLVHWALEKMLKAHVVRVTGDAPPQMHNLIRLAQLAGLKPAHEQERALRRFDLYQLEGRSLDSQQVALTPGLAEEELQKAVEILQWLK
jgi:HEPN domain-containing protein